MALQYVPTKLDPNVVLKIEKDVKKKKFQSRNDAINTILKTHYEEEEKGKKKS